MDRADSPPVSLADMHRAAGAAWLRRERAAQAAADIASTADTTLDALLARAAAGDRQAAADFHAARDARMTVATRFITSARTNALRMLATDPEDTMTADTTTEPTNLHDDEPVTWTQTLYLARYPGSADALFSTRELARGYCDDQHAYRNRGPAAATRWTSSEHGYDEQHRTVGGPAGGVVTVLVVDDQT